MKFCYLDESGTGEEPFGVMVGIVTDSRRMHVTKEHWKELLKTLSETLGRDVKEIHTRNLYSGSSIWYRMDGLIRSVVIDLIFKWISDRKHHIVFSAVNKKKFYDEFKSEVYSGEVKTLWSFLAFHTVLSLQKKYQSEKNNKGNFILIFDNEKHEQIRISDLLLNPPEWSESFYLKQPNQKSMDQMIDVPYFGDSKEVALIQVADFVAYFIRRYIELSEGICKEDYSGEFEKIKGWFSIILSRSIGLNHSFPKRNNCYCAKLFLRYTPECIKAL